MLPGPRADAARERISTRRVTPATHGRSAATHAGNWVRATTATDCSSCVCESSSASAPASPVRLQHALLVSRDFGTLHAAGCNDDGQLGVGHRCRQNEAVRVANALDSGARAGRGRGRARAPRPQARQRRMRRLTLRRSHWRVAHVACGSAHSLVVTRDGEVFAFGSDANGQLRLGGGSDTDGGAKRRERGPSGLPVSIHRGISAPASRGRVVQPVGLLRRCGYALACGMLRLRRGAGLRRERGGSLAWVIRCGRRHRNASQHVAFVSNVHAASHTRWC